MAEPVRRPGGRSARVRRQVLDATAQLLLEEGLDAATIVAVAERSGVHHTSIYRRWGDRAALIRDALLDAVDTAVPVRNTGNLLDELTHMLDDVLALYQSPLGPVLMEAVRSTDPALAELRRTYFSARVMQCAAIAERAKARGELPENADPRLAFELLMGPLIARSTASSEGVKTLNSETVVRAVLYGIATPSTAHPASADPGGK